MLPSHHQRSSVMPEQNKHSDLPLWRRIDASQDSLRLLLGRWLCVHVGPWQSTMWTKLSPQPYSHFLSPRHPLVPLCLPCKHWLEAQQQSRTQFCSGRGLAARVCLWGLAVAWKSGSPLTRLTSNRPMLCWHIFQSWDFESAVLVLSLTEKRPTKLFNVNTKCYLWKCLKLERNSTA